MAFCAKCGSSVEGAFCASCGASAAGSPAPPPVPPPAPPVPAVRNGVRPIVWVLGGVLTLAIIGVAAYAVWGGSGLNKAQRAAPDPGLKQPKTAVAEVAKMVAAGNPNLDVIYADEDSGKIVFSERTTGRIGTATVEEAQAGKISFKAAAAGAVAPPPLPAMNSTAPPETPSVPQSPPVTPSVPQSPPETPLVPQSPPGVAAPRYSSPETIVAEARSIAVVQTDGDFAIQESLVNNLTKWGGLAVVSDPGGADLILEVRQISAMSIYGESNRASATLIHRASSRHLWSGTKGGAAFSGLSKGLVSRAIAKDVIKYVDRLRRR